MQSKLYYALTVLVVLGMLAACQPAAPADPAAAPEAAAADAQAAAPADVKDVPREKTYVVTLMVRYGWHDARI